MKLFKLIPALSVVTLGFAPIGFTTSCNKDKTSEEETASWEIDKSGYEEFIYNRTFSIMAKDTKNAVYGTGWILADATPTTYNDYQYYIGTNWHVTQGFKELTSPTYHFADKSCSSSSLITINNYIKFKSFYFAKENQFKYSVNEANADTPVIDFFVAKVDFNNGMTTSIKNKLDALNAKQKKDGCINVFGTLNDFKTGNKYVGGFPYNESSKGTKWEVHGINSSVFKYRDCYPHNISETTYPYTNYLDYSEQLEFTKNAKNFMPGGASGSMIINSDYKVCGVYWGGWKNTITNEYFPAFSFINGEDGNFIKKSYDVLS